MVAADIAWTGLYHRATLDATLAGRAGSVRIFPGSGWAGESICPLQLGIPLGGDDGFPGLHIGERRGDREAMLDVLLATPIKGPLLARVELAGGRAGVGWAVHGFQGLAGGCARGHRGGDAGRAGALRVRSGHRRP